MTIPNMKTEISNVPEKEKIEILAIADRLKQIKRVQKVILFGSFAR